MENLETNWTQCDIDLWIIQVLNMKNCDHYGLLEQLSKFEVFYRIILGHCNEHRHPVRKQRFNSWLINQGNQRVGVYTVDKDITGMPSDLNVHLLTLRHCQNCKRKI